MTDQVAGQVSGLNGTAAVPDPPSDLSEGLPPWAAFDPLLLDPHNVMRQPLQFPGWEGLPFRGSSISRKEDDPEPEPAFESHVDILSLWEPAHLDRYRQIHQLRANGVAIVEDEKPQWIADKMNWHIFIRWQLVFSHQVKGMFGGSVGGR